MRDQAHPPTQSNPTILEGGARLGMFWTHCKHRNKCTSAPYDRLLTNPVLKTDYRTTSWHERHNVMTTQRGPDDSAQKEVHSRAELSALKCTRSQQLAGLTGGETLRSPRQRVALKSRQPQFEVY